MHDNLNAKITEAHQLLIEKLGGSKHSLADNLRRSGPRLPRGIRRDAAYLAEAAQLAAHPRLALTLDLPALDKAADRVLDHLRAIDIWDRRKGALLGMLGGLVFNLLVAFVLLLILLIWRGFL